MEELRKYYLSDVTKDYQFRINALKSLASSIVTHQDEILNALQLDLAKHQFEAYSCEIGIVLHEISLYLKKLKKWMKPKKVKTPMMHFFSSSKLYQEPYGVVLIMAPWNYPFQLSLMPLIGAIASGNCAVLKPSNYAPHTADVIEKIIASTFPANYIKVVKGGREVNQHLLDQKFDYIFFTGSPSVGKVVMEKASANLIPVTLELGGKSPCIVDESASLELAAKRIVWGKFLNAGQTCVAPDYIYAHKDIADQLAEYLKKFICDLYGSDPCHNPDYPKIINQHHFDRLSNLLQGHKAFYGGQTNQEELKIAPSIVKNVSFDDPLMKEEIFGPILPMMVYEDIDEVINQSKQLAKPLALYLFSTNRNNQKKIISSLSFGGGCINDTIIHVASCLPFGGVGQSGIGQYHGHSSFLTFSHPKGIIKKSNLFDISLRYPPYKKDIKLIKKILK